MRRRVGCAALLVIAGCRFEVQGTGVPAVEDLTVPLSDTAIPLDDLAAAPPDLSLVDQAARADTAAPDDLATRDLALRDLAGPRDLALPDLALPDLARPDLSLPDLSLPDLSLPDLSLPDLYVATCSDGVENGTETDVDCGGNCPACALGKSCAVAADCQDSYCAADQCQLATSCEQILGGDPGASSGSYTIDPTSSNHPISAQCDMTSSGGGWTLCAKIDGTQDTWLYAANTWTNTTTFGTADLSANEAKLAPFNSLTFSTVRVQMVDGASHNAVDLVPAGLPAGATLRSVFNGGYLATNIGRAAWLALPASGSLETNCNQEGLNNKVADGNMRIGIFGNNENDCNTCDSFIGIGQDQLASGNVNSSQWDNSGAGGRDTKTFTYLWVR